MKKMFFTAMMAAALLCGSPLFAQLSFYGDYTGTLVASVREDDYESALNPDNVYGLTDLNLSNELTLKMAGGDELADLELWFSLDQYHIGAGLLAAAYGDLSQEAYAYSIISEAGDYIYTFDLMRASVGWTLGDNALVRLGRQSLFTGYGYGWNPMDFANPAKDPSDPKAELRGVDSLALHLLPWNPVNLKVYALYDRDLIASGADYDDLMGGGELTFSLPALEMKLTGFLEWDGSEGEDGRVDALGAGFLADVAGIGLYGEGALLSGSRTESPDGSRRQELVFNILAGAEYVFLTETSLVAEYFYNGEGYDGEERDDLLAAMSAQASLYRPGYYSRHYVLVNLAQPFYAVNTDANLTALYSVDSGALTLMPSVIWYGSGSFTLTGQYAGLLNLTGDDASENALAPVKHVFSLEAQFSF